MKHSTGLLRFFGRPELQTVLPAVLLTLGGLFVVSSVTGDTPGRMTVQSVACGLGICVFLLSWLLPKHPRSHRFYLALFCLNCLMLTAVVLFGEGPGNRAWIRIPGLFFDMQLCEPGKVLYLLTLSYHIPIVTAQKPTGKSVLLLCGHVLLPPILVLLTADVGNALIYGLIAIVLLLFSGLPKRWFAMGAGCALLLSPAVWIALGQRRQDRIIAGFIPSTDPLGYGFQALSARKVLLASSFFGKGYGHVPACMHVPAVQTDMIFLALCEQFGILGGTVGIVLLLCLCLSWILRSRRFTGQIRLFLVTAGIWVLAQSVYVISMTAGILPIIGITLPFLSYGGSSLFSMWLLCGVVLRLCRE